MRLEQGLKLKLIFLLLDYKSNCLCMLHSLHGILAKKICGSRRANELQLLGQGYEVSTIGA